ncbi:M14 family metallopeptidase [Elusimicrobiota bacterium]
MKKILNNKYRNILIGLSIAALALALLPSMLKSDPFVKVREAFGEAKASQPHKPVRISEGSKPLPKKSGRYWVTIRIKETDSIRAREIRTRIANAGVAIAVVDLEKQVVEGTADDAALERLRKMNLSITIISTVSVEQLSKYFPLDFPREDAPYHNYYETKNAMSKIASDSQYSKFVSMFSIGRSVKGNKEIHALRFNTSARNNAASDKPGIVFMANHHAREHLSTEIPIMLAKYMALNSNKSDIKKFIDTRDIYFIFIVNPDGKAYDIETGDYRWWRKNRRRNHDGSYGVDLNRNYGGPNWGGKGASRSPSSETYAGASPFSEPETQAIRDFVLAHPNINILLSYHSFSQLILYPWGHTYSPIADSNDLQAYRSMAKVLAGHTGYTPQQSSDLYIASGDTTDWAYAKSKELQSSGLREMPLFAFTFELEPKSRWDGAFYPGPRMIETSFSRNLPAALYLIEIADNPYQGKS